MKTMRSIAILSVLFCAGARAQLSGVVPVGKEMLDGTRLVLQNAGCSFDLPGPDWKWMGYEGNKTQNYLCVNSRTNVLFGVAVGHLHMALTDHQPKSLIENAKKAIAARKGKIENDKFDFVDIPSIKKCVRVTFQEIEASGTKSLVTIYLINTVDEISIKLQCAGTFATEPESFKALLNSIHLTADKNSK